MNIQRRYGLFPRIIGKGDCARRLADALIRMRSEGGAILARLLWHQVVFLVN